MTMGAAGSSAGRKGEGEPGEVPLAFPDPETLSVGL